ncbi:MAG TPA: MFS transporter, partial [Ktedonobacterales bacterium]
MVAEPLYTEAPPKRLPLFALYTANAVSQTGDMLTFLAVPWFVLQTTGSIAQTGITTFFTFASVGLSALFGGAFIDRLGFQRASVVSDLASMLGVALIPLLYATVGLPFWALLVLVFLAGLLTTPGQTARYALVPDLAQLAHARIERVTAARDSVTRLSRFVGAPLAGVLIAIIGTSNLLWIDAATFAVSALVIGLAVPVQMPVRSTGQLPAETRAAASSTPLAEPDVALLSPDESNHTPGVTSSDTSRRAERPAGYLSGLREGVSFLWRDRVLRDTTLVVFLTNALDTGQSGVLAPAFVKQMYGNAVILGAMIAAFGGAAFAGTIVFGAIGHKLPRRLTLTVGYTLGGGSRFFWIVLLAPTPVAMVASQALCGFCIGPVNPIYTTLDYERVPVALRARVFGVLTAGSMLGAPLGGLLAGAVAPAIGVEPSMLFFGVVYSLATLSLLVDPAL